MRKNNFKGTSTNICTACPDQAKSLLPVNYLKNMVSLVINSNLIRHTLLKTKLRQNENHIIAGIMDMMTETVFKSWRQCNI